MAKRELIDREQVITEIKYMDNNGFITRTVNHVCEDIRMIPAITEQDIVKSYLEKLKADIEVAYDELDGYDPDALGTFASRIDDLIDNLLPESEG